MDIIHTLFHNVKHFFAFNPDNLVDISLQKKKKTFGARQKSCAVLQQFIDFLIYSLWEARGDG